MTSSGWPSINGGLEEIGAIPGALCVLLDEGQTWLVAQEFVPNEPQAEVPKSPWWQSFLNRA